MFSATDLMMIANFAKKNFPSHVMSFNEGYDDNYVIFEIEPDEREGRVVVACQTIYAEEG